MLFARGRAPDTTHAAAREEGGPQEGSPLRLRAAAQMAIVFQLSLSAIGAVLDRWGSPGLYPTASVLGLTDVDALTASMSRIDAGISAEMAARAIAVGIVANTALKIGIAAVLGRGRFRRVAITGLLALGLFVYQFGLGTSILAAGLTLALLILPVVIVATREAIRAVPRTITSSATSRRT